MSTPSEPETKQPGLPGLPPIDVNEYGGKKDGERQAMNRRLFMQLLVFDAPAGEAADEIGKDLAAQLRHNAIAGVVYADASSPRGLGLLTWSEDPAHFVQAVRPLFARRLAAQGGPAPAVRDARPHLRHGPRAGPRARAPAPRHPERDERRSTRGTSGTRSAARARSRGSTRRSRAASCASTRRSASPTARPSWRTTSASRATGSTPRTTSSSSASSGASSTRFSHLVQTMRKTRQTSEYIAKMGPFFVGFVLHRHG